MPDFFLITFGLFLVIFALTSVVSLLSIMEFGPGKIPLVTLPPRIRNALFYMLIGEVVTVIVGAGYTATQLVATTNALLARSTIEMRQPSPLHDYVLLQRDITRVRILGLNALGVLHKYRRDFVELLRRKDTRVEILLLDPDSDAFLDRRNLEETAPQEPTTGQSQFVSGRILDEWKASLAVLRDIVNQLVNQHSMDIKELSKRLKIKKHSLKPEYSFLFVDISGKEHFLIYNKYEQEPQFPGTSGGSSLVYPGERDYWRAETRFEFLWEHKDTSEIELEVLKSKLTPLSQTGREESAVHARLARAFMAEQRMELGSFRLARSIRLEVPVYHPQGMTYVNGHFFVSAVEVIERPQLSQPPDAGRKPDGVQGKGRGHLFKFDHNGKLIDQIILGEGPIYHPGGIGYDGKYLWVPVAEYRPYSRTIVYRVDPVDLKHREAFRVDDHIGALVFNGPDQLIHGVSWASRQFYTWTPSGDLVERSENGNHYVDYQDCQFVRPKYMLCSGMAMYSLPANTEFALGGIELVQITDYLPIHQIPVAIYPDDNAEVVMTRNAMFAELRSGVLTFYFLPEDSTAAQNGGVGIGSQTDPDAKQAFSTIYVVEARKPQAPDP